MPELVFRQFRGLIPRLDAKKLPEQNAQIARNLKLVADRIEPMNGLVDTADVADDVAKVYLWHRNDSTEWLTWTADRDVARGPIADDQYDRIYVSGGTNLQVIGWDGSKDERNVGLSSPSAPTIGTAPKFDSSKLGCEYYRVHAGGNIHQTLRLMAWQIVDRELTMTWEVEQYAIPAGALQRHFFRLQYDGTYIPANALTADWGTIFDEYLDLQYAAQTYARLTVNDHIVEHSWHLDEWDGDGYSPRHAATISCDIASLNPVLTDQLKYYVSTFVDDWGAESAPSAISDPIEWKVDDVVTLTLPGATPAGENIVTRRIYRSAAGSQEDAFFYVGEVDENVGTFVDSVPDAELGEELVLVENPPQNLKGIIIMDAGFAVAFKENMLYMSEVNILYSWPTKYRMVLDEQIVAIAKSGNDIIVMTDGIPHAVHGVHPRTMSSTPIRYKQPCVSKRGVAVVGDLVLYPSPDGYVGVADRRAQLLTETLYTKDEWTALTPENMIAACYDKQLIVYVGSSVVNIFDFRAELPLLTDALFTGVTVLGFHEEISEDTLYLLTDVSGDVSIDEWEGGAGMTATWKSKIFVLPRPFAWQTIRAVAESYDSETVSAALFSGPTQALVNSPTLTSNAARRLAKLRPEREWCITIQTTTPIDEFTLATAMEAMRST